MAAIGRTSGTQRHFDRLRRHETLTAWAFLAPYLITAVIFTFGLLLYALYTSFTNLEATYQTTAARFEGLANYARAFGDPVFQQALVNIVWYALIVTSVQTVLAVIIASLLNAKLAGIGLLRTLIYSPSVASSVVVALIFIWLFLPTGIINYIFRTDINWLGDPNGLFEPIIRALGRQPFDVPYLLRGPSVAWLAIMVLNIFTSVPTFMLLFLQLPQLMTLPIGMGFFKNQYSSDYAAQLVGAMMNAIPVLILFFSFSRVFTDTGSYAGLAGQ
jgi:multiple sugar transport system permease protein